MTNNFPPGKPFGEPLIVGEALDNTLELAKRVYSYRHPFVMSLVACGVLPTGCSDFRIDVPVEGVLTITATYFVDKDSFEKAIRKTFAAESETLAKGNEEYAKKSAKRKRSGK
jgi:hypothetical protein